eukprot:SAG11_NODE_29219_length_313_cov_0.934579_1_plen_75_part_01
MALQWVGVCRWLLHSAHNLLRTKCQVISGTIEIAIEALWWLEYRVGSISFARDSRLRMLCFPSYTIVLACTCMRN